MSANNAKYRVWENNHLMFETDDLAEAKDEWKRLHLVNPNAYHEIYELQGDGQYHGIRQLKPHDSIS